MSFAYEDILYLPHHVSEKRARMPAIDRAAQFSPFAALTGYDTAVTETARLTCDRIALDEDARLEIDAALGELSRHLAEGPKAVITHFVPDERKAGGSYRTTEAAVRRIDPQAGCLLLEDGRCILFQDIAEIKTGRSL